MEYCIVLIRGLDAQRRFVRKVCDLIQQGWTPQGGVCCVVEDGEIAGWSQAVIRTQPVTQRISVRAKGWEDITLMTLSSEVGL